MLDVAKVADLYGRIIACQLAIATNESDLEGYSQALAEECCPHKKYDILQNLQGDETVWVFRVLPRYPASPATGASDIIAYKMKNDGNPGKDDSVSNCYGYGKTYTVCGHLTPEQIQQIEEQS